jgi:hypothetical protein
MHRQLVEQLIAEEVERARGDDRLRDRVQLEQAGTRVLVHARRTDGPVLLALDGPNYDAEPFALMALDPETHAPLAAAKWPPNLVYGQEHTVLRRPWSCLAGTYEYYRWPGHNTESWDQLRYHLDLPTLVGQLVNKAQCL